MTSSTPPLGGPGERCRSCAAPLAEDQRYCLNCGQRRAETRVAREFLLHTDRPDLTDSSRVAAPAAPAPAAFGPRTISPMGAAAGLGLLLFAVLTGATLGNRAEPTAAAPQTLVAMPASTTPAASTPTAFVSDWTGADGWTVQLQTLAKAGSTPEQVAAAKTAATTAGAPDVGALDSSAFPSLPADTYVIYSGRFDDKKAAKAALKDLKASFPEATVIEVSTTATTAADDAPAEKVEVDEATSKALDDLGSASGEDYVKKSKKLPDDVGTEGTPPPTDDAAPGAGSDATEIQ